MTLLEKALPHFRELLDVVLASTSVLSFTLTNPQHLLAASLHASILEHAHGIMILLRAGNPTCSLILLRSILEASVDLCNLAADPAYAEFMHCALLEQRRRVLAMAVQAAAKENPYLADFAEHQRDADTGLARVRDEIQQLEGRGIKPLSARERFQRAHRLGLYQGPYAYLCWHSHNNINILEERHLRQTSDRATIEYFRPPNDDDVVLALDTAAGLVADSTAILFQLLGGSPRSELGNVTRRLDEIRVLWKKRV